MPAAAAARAREPVSAMRSSKVNRVPPRSCRPPRPSQSSPWGCRGRDALDEAAFCPLGAVLYGFRDGFGGFGFFAAPLRGFAPGRGAFAAVLAGIRPVLTARVRMRIKVAKARRGGVLQSIS